MPLSAQPANPSPPTSSGKWARRLKSFARWLFFKSALNLRYSLTPGLSVFGINIFADTRRGPPRFRSSYALDSVIRLNPQSVLDVGSGDGRHARLFAANGARVLCVDFGTSIYAKASDEDGLDVLHVDFNDLRLQEKFDLVWASHVLEHQRNVGFFVERLISFCRDEGKICITVPDPHRHLWGGHLSVWSPGLLAYNIVLCGIDLSNALFVRGTNEFSIVFSPTRRALPSTLTFDSGDLDKLASYMPQRLRENADPWRVRYSSG